jgi:hypothetical protein
VFLGYPVLAMSEPVIKCEVPVSDQCTTNAYAEASSPLASSGSPSEPFLNSFWAWPSERASLGNWVLPNKRSAIAKMIRSSWPPSAAARVMRPSVPTSGAGTSGAS